LGVPAASILPRLSTVTRSQMSKIRSAWCSTKSTLLKAISGLLPRTGTITFAGRDMSKAGPREAVNAGLVHVVEGHRVFTQLNVHDNVMLAGYGMKGAELEARVEEALAFFPEIAEKRNDRAITRSFVEMAVMARPCRNALRTLKKWDRPWQERDISLEKIMSSYWLNFVKTSNPNGEGLPEWKAYDRAEGFIIEFNEGARPRPGLFKAEFEALDKVN